MSSRLGSRAPTRSSTASDHRTKRERREVARATQEERRRRQARRLQIRRMGLAAAGLLVLAGLGFGIRSIAAPKATPLSPNAVGRIASVRFSASDGTPFTLAGLRGSKVVLYFYEGQSCGACQTQLQQLEAQLPDLEKRGARVVAATTDPIGVSTSVAQQLNLSYPIVEDRDHLLGSAFGTYEAAGHMGSVDQHSIVVLDARGRVVWRRLAGTTMYVAPDDIVQAVERA